MLHVSTPAAQASRHRAGRVVGACAIVTALAGALAGCASDNADAGSEQSTGAQGTAAVSFTDLAGRQVELDHEPERVILGEGRSVFATGILNKEDPLDKVVAIGSDLKQNVPDYYHELEKATPKVNELPEIGGFTKGDVTVEELISLDPDLIVLSKDQYEASQTAGLTDKLDQAGLTYAVTDFRAKPLENTVPTMRIFADIFGHEDRAEEFIADWQKNVDLVTERATKAQGKPSTFVWRAAGISDCCGSWNDSNISELVNVAGGKNVADDIIEGESGALTPEKVIDADPDMIIATGGDWSAKVDNAKGHTGFAAVGYGISDKDAHDSAATLAGVQPGFEDLSAVKEHNLHGLWHQFYNSPFNYLALLQIAAWLHPEDYTDVNVQQEWAEAQEKYSPVPGDGTFFSTN
ncbi:ABC transporter substrate-binding protein [Corynebacterium aurimucosum]|uniref:Iron ABC transport system, solute-binding protein n=1 Tax=Corynebacterium aurimucosum (strain ATCC 700975 / DSM 44827 / CIP 107346 / CN-1) TaxID=548476 RepID=C3PIL0_CORA7|nr:ABC transporter substrate-binding protein [Corynebacterium aurimucosum]ACP33664.1 iron ABC transport system, solute-binding protein [Corynebacterium aurimucosum ATCC 700975]QQU92223.1 ABC transporter substrate-binding protein [Corynebacterium aurimucosum]